MALSSDCVVWAEAEWSAQADGVGIERARSGPQPAGLLLSQLAPTVAASFQLDPCLGLLICLCSLLAFFYIVANEIFGS